MRRLKVALLTVCLCLFPACDQKKKVSITGAGTDQPGAFCSDFRLTESQARQFFAKAKPVTEKQPAWVDFRVRMFAGQAGIRFVHLISAAVRQAWSEQIIGANGVRMIGLPQAVENK